MRCRSRYQFVMALAAPSSVELWSGDADLEPLVLTMYRTYEKQLNHKECVAHLRKAEWRIDVALGLGKIDLQQRKVRSMEAEVQAAQAQLQAYEDERAERELAIHREAMENAEAYAGGQEALVMAANDAKAREMVVQLGTMEAAVRASEARAVRAEQAVADADERQAAATRGLRAEVSRLEAEVAAREALRDENVRLRQQIAELRLGGRATKMAIADEYEAEISMSRLLWEVCSPTHRRELYATQDVVQRDAVGRALTRQLEAARQACGALLPMLWEHVARTQALAKALDVEPELEQLAEEARRSGVGPADVDRIARELTRMERAEQSADLAQAAAAKSLAAAEEVAAKAKEHLEGLEAAVSQLEEEHPGIFEPKTAAEASENDGKLTPEEIEAASLMERLLKARGEWERETAVGRARAEERGERQTEHRRCAELMQGLRRERSHWREGPTLPERISVAEAREQRLQALYDERAAGMAALHTKIRFL